MAAAATAPCALRHLKVVTPALAARDGAAVAVILGVHLESMAAKAPGLRERRCKQHARVSRCGHGGLWVRH
jgi:hypothetical protein